jgi:hypothetical protein
MKTRATEHVIEQGIYILLRKTTFWKSCAKRIFITFITLVSKEKLCKNNKTTFLKSCAKV